MKIKIKANVPSDQTIEATCFHDKDCDAYLLNIFVGHADDKDPKRIIGEELTLAIQNQEQLEKFIELIRKAGKKIKGKGRTEPAVSKKSADGTAS